MSSLVTISELPELSLNPVDHSELVKIVTDLVAEKPKSVVEALKLIGTLQEKIADWVLSDVPDKDKVLASLKAVEVITKSVGCLSCFK